MLLSFAFVKLQHSKISCIPYHTILNDNCAYLDPITSESSSSPLPISFCFTVEWKIIESNRKQFLSGFDICSKTVNSI